MPPERSRQISRRAALRSIAGGTAALGIMPLLSACGQGAPDAESSAPTAELPQAPAATSAAQSTITVWYYDGSLGETVEGFKRANPGIGVDLKTFGDAEQGLLRALE